MARNFKACETCEWKDLDASYDKQTCWRCEGGWSNPAYEKAVSRVWHEMLPEGFHKPSYKQVSIEEVFDYCIRHKKLAPNHMVYGHKNEMAKHRLITYLIYKIIHGEIK